jgi:hypothetical protein
MFTPVTNEYAYCGLEHMDLKGTDPEDDGEYEEGAAGISLITVDTDAMSNLNATAKGIKLVVRKLTAAHADRVRKLNEQYCRINCSTVSHVISASGYTGMVISKHHDFCTSEDSATQYARIPNIRNYYARSGCFLEGDSTFNEYRAVIRSDHELLKGRSRGFRYACEGLSRGMVVRNIYATVLPRPPMGPSNNTHHIILTEEHLRSKILELFKESFGNGQYGEDLFISDNFNPHSSRYSQDIIQAVKDNPSWLTEAGYQAAYSGVGSNLNEAGHDITGVLVSKVA